MEQHLIPCFLGNLLRGTAAPLCQEAEDWSRHELPKSCQNIVLYSNDLSWKRKRIKCWARASVIVYSTHDWCGVKREKSEAKWTSGYLKTTTIGLHILCDGIIWHLCCKGLKRQENNHSSFQFQVCIFILCAWLYMLFLPLIIAHTAVPLKYFDFLTYKLLCCLRGC